MRFLHTADWQLGMTRHFLAGDAQPRYSAARRDAVAGLGALAAEVGAEFVVVAGDVFEHNQLAPQVISQSLEAMRAIGIPVYLLPGNHDPLDASSVYTSALFNAERPDNVVVLDRAGVHRGAAGTRDRRGAMAFQGPHHRPGRRSPRSSPGPGTGAGDPHPCRARRRRRARPRPRQALADPARRPRRGIGTRCAALRGPGRQALAHPGRRQRAGVVLRLAGGHQLRRHGIRPRSRPGRRHQRKHPRGHRYGKGRRPLAVRHAAPPGGHQPRHRRPGHEPGPDDRQGTHRGAAGAHRLVDGHRPRGAGRVPGPIPARCSPRLGTWDRHTDLAVVPADGEFTDLGIGGFAAAAVDELVASARGDDDAALDAQAALALLLRLADRGAA